MADPGIRPVSICTRTFNGPGLRPYSSKFGVDRNKAWRYAVGGMRTSHRKQLESRTRRWGCDIPGDVYSCDKAELIQRPGLAGFYILCYHDPFTKKLA